MKKNRILKKIKTEHIVLTIILILASFLRIWSLGTPGLWIDESTSAMAARMILEKGEPRLDSGLFYGRALFFHYTQAFFQLFGQNDFWVRFPSVIFGLLTVVLAYYIGKEYSKKSGGILAALFTTVFYLEVFYSRQARFYQLFQLLFFASLYFLYKSKQQPKWLIPATITFILCLDTQIAGLVLAPFFIIHTLMYNKKLHKLTTIIPLAYLIKYFIPTSTLTTVGTEGEAINYASTYFEFTRNMYYMLILFIPGAIWAFFKKKRLTTLIILPSIIMLIGITTLKTFALRYAYFFALPLVIYSSLLLSFLYEKFGKGIIPAIILVLIIPSNLIHPYTYVNVIKPIDYNYNDYSAPTINLKPTPEEVKNLLRNSTVIVYFSSTYEWYIKKPTYVLPFSMNGIGYDQISMENSEGLLVDEYSGAPILPEKPKGAYYLVADVFSVSKLKGDQITLHNDLINNCTILYENPTVKIWECLPPDYYRVSRVIDGDTLQLQNEDIVRLICIDTPEKGEPGADEATQYLESLVLNKIVRLEKDVSEKDKYDRLLRYVYVDDVFVNKQLVKEGHAEVFRYGEDTKRCGEIEN
jgi:hypothetical protein